jgi:hypothetical protein
LAAYDRYRRITALIPTSWSLAEFVDNVATARFVETKQLPTNAFPADAATADLPSPHDGIPILGCANSMDLNETGKPVVSECQTATGIQSITSDVPPHKSSPESFGDSDSTKGEGA